MPDFITKDFVWKLASIILAIVIWVTVDKYREGTLNHGAPTENTYSDLPVLVFSTAADARVYQIAPQKVSVKVSGPSAAMDVLQGDQIHPFVDLTGIESARNFRVQVEIALPKGVSLDDVDPPWVGVLMPKH